MISVGNILRGVTLMLLCTALGGCMGNGGSSSGAAGGSAGGSGGGTGGGTTGGGSTSPNASAIQQQVDRIGNLGPTQDMPLSGSATYRGGAAATLNRGNQAVGEMLGDVEMSVNFANAANPARQSEAVSGRMNNFRGTVDGEAIAFDGELTTAIAASRSMPSTIMTTTTDMTLPGVGNISTRLGSLMVNFGGDLEIDEQSGPVNVMLGGAFMGGAAQGATGPVVGTWWDLGNPEQYTVGGTYYVERQ